MIHKGKLFVALDMPDRGSARKMVDLLRDLVDGFKIGSILFTLGGPEIVHDLGVNGFLDLKYHEQADTVYKTVRVAAQLPVKFLTVHCSGGSKMMREAARAVKDHFREHHQRPYVLGVTILTGLDETSLYEMGITPNMSIPQRVAHLAWLAHQADLDGVVCSIQENRSVRERVDDKSFIIMNAGVRMPEDIMNDQVRTSHPREAIDSGGNYIVVGRPITEAPDPRAAVMAILKNMEG